MFASIATRYDTLNSILSLGIHRYWQKKLLQLLPQEDTGPVLDLCTGTGALLPGLHKRFKKTFGADFCLPMLEQGRKLRLPILQGDALRLPLKDKSLSGITVAYGVRNFSDLSTGLAEAKRALSANGWIAILEFGQPSGLLELPYKFYSKYALPFIGGLISGNSSAYKYLQETAEKFPCGPKFCEVLERSGFKLQTWQKLTFGVAHIYIARVQQ